VGALRSRGHAKLIGRLEVVENLAPVALVVGTAAMALVHDDEVEEIARVFFVQAGTVRVLGDGLVDGEVHLAALVDLAALNLESRVAEDGEGLVLRIVYQHIAIGEEQDFRTTIFAGAIPATVP